MLPLAITYFSDAGECESVYGAPLLSSHHLANWSDTGSYEGSYEYSKYPITPLMPGSPGMI